MALVTDELVSNAVRHAHNDIDVTVSDEADGTKIAVSDDDDRAPSRFHDDDDNRESGRGFSLIDALSDEVGVTPRSIGGKVIWARLRWRRR